MFGIENVLAFLLASTLLIIIPGPATFYVAGQAHLSAGHGRYATIGIIVGDIVLISLSGLGFAALVSQWPTFLLLIKLAGAIYVAYLGYTLLRTMPGTVQMDRQATQERQTPYESLMKGILITLTNPKPILFFATFFPLFIKGDATSGAKSFYILGLIFEALNIFYFSLIILTVVGLRQVSALRQFSSRGQLHKISGYGLLLCSAFILSSTLLG